MKFAQLLDDRRRGGKRIRDGDGMLEEVLEWQQKDVMNPRLLVADARLRPNLPDTFDDLHEYVLSFTGLMVEEIKESIAQAFTAPEPSAAAKVAAFDANRVSGRIRTRNCASKRNDLGTGCVPISC